MQDDPKKVENARKIFQQVKDIQESYRSETSDPVEEELSFLDKMNKLIRSILGDSSISIYQALDKGSLDLWRKKRFTRWIKNAVFGNIRNFLYFTLLASITTFLVSEAITFYGTAGAITFKTYVKAILTEVSFIFLSGYRTSTRFQMIGVGVLRVSIFVLMLFVISSDVWMRGTKSVGETEVVQQQIEILVKQISDKDGEIRYYRDVKNWPITTKQLIKEKQKMVTKLIELKDKQASGSTKEVSKLVIYNMYAKAFFRTLLLFISVLITRRIFSF